MMYGLNHVADSSLSLPPECLAQMMQYCDVRTLGRACTVARHWRAEAESRRMWRHLCRKVYPSLFHDCPALLMPPQHTPGSRDQQTQQQQEQERDEVAARRFLPASHTRSPDPYRSLLYLRSFVLAKKLVRWDQQDQEAWAYGAVYVDVNVMDVRDGSRGASVGSLVLKGLPRTHREGMLRYHSVRHQPTEALTPPRLFVSLEEVCAYLERVPLQCSAIMMMHPPGQQVGDEEAGWWYPGSGGSSEALPLVHCSSVTRVVERTWTPQASTDALPEVHKQGLAMVVEMVDSGAFLPRFLSWPQPLTGVLHYYFGAHRGPTGFSVHLLGMRFFKEG